MLAGLPSMTEVGHLLLARADPARRRGSRAPWAIDLRSSTTLALVPEIPQSRAEPFELLAGGTVAVAVQAGAVARVSLVDGRGAGGADGVAVLVRRHGAARCGRDRGRGRRRRLGDVVAHLEGRARVRRDGLVRAGGAPGRSRPSPVQSPTARTSPSRPPGGRRTRSGGPCWAAATSRRPRHPSAGSRRRPRPAGSRGRSRGRRACGSATAMRRWPTRCRVRRRGRCRSGSRRRTRR